MNKVHKAVLKQFHQELANDIVVTEEFLGEMFQVEIFDSSLVDIIKSAPTDTDKVHKLLNLLPKRGPEAFEKFIKVLKKNYSWLATLLASPPETKSVQEGGDASIYNQNGDTNRQSNAHSKEHDNSGLDGADMDIKKLVADFLHKQFGQSKKIMESEMESVEKFLANQIQMERTRYQRINFDTTQDGVVRSREKCKKVKKIRLTKIQDHLFKMYKKIQYVSDTITTTAAAASNIQGSSDSNDQCDNNRAHIYQATLNPEDMNFELFEEKMDALIHQYELLEDTINYSMDFFDAEVRNEPLSILVENVVERCKALEEKRTQDNQTISEMSSQVDALIRQYEPLEATINDSLAFFGAEVRNEPLPILVKNVVKRCKALEEKRTQDNQTISEMSSQIEDYFYDIDRLEKEIVKQRKQIQTANKDKASMAEKIRELEDRLLDMTLDSAANGRQNSTNNDTNATGGRRRGRSNLDYPAHTMRSLREELVVSVRDGEVNMSTF